jgi:hypothetical protein
MKVREFISIVRNSLDSINQDNYISGEMIFNVGVSFATLFTKREADSAKAFKNTSSFKFIECIKMKEVNAIECSDFKLPCNTIMRSVEKLPTPFLSKYGSIIKVYNLTGEKDYAETNPVGYKSISKQRYQSKQKAYFFIKNDYLWIPDSQVEAVSAMILSPDIRRLAKGCVLLDEPFPVLDYLEAAVIESTVKQLLTSKNIQRDENANLDERT